MYFKVTFLWGDVQRGRTGNSEGEALKSASLWTGHLIPKHAPSVCRWATVGLRFLSVFLFVVFKKKALLWCPLL